MVYQYTMPRGPITASFKGPGPCYVLPNLTGQTGHDFRSTYSKAPGYFIGLRSLKERIGSCSPGPIYLPQHKIYKDGRDGTPHFSLADRRPMTSGMVVPGPGSYYPDKNYGSPAYQRAPSYSFRKRTAVARGDNTPGPNVYTLDRMMGNTVRSGKKSAPGYSMVGKNPVGSFCADLSRSPGPGTYGTTSPNIYRPKSAGYSLAGRNPLPGDKTKIPGPGAHAPEKNLYSTKKRMPEFTFGIRHSEYKAPLIIEPVT